MATLQIKKKSLRTWEHIDSQLGMFILSKFEFSTGTETFQVVEANGAKRRIYNISDIEVFDIGGTAETFGTVTQLSLRLEELKYPGFYRDGDFIFEIDPNRVVISDASGNLEGADVGFYPDLTEISFVKGLISPAQPQIDGKQATLTETNVGGFNNGLTTENAIASGDLFSYVDVSDSNKQKKTTWSNIVSVLTTAFNSVYQAILTAGNFGAFTNSLTTNDSLADGDLFSYSDVSDSNNQKKTSWLNIKTLLAKKEVVCVQNRWTLTTADNYYRTRYDFAGFNVDTLTVSAVASNYAGLSQQNRSQSSFFYTANGAKKLNKIYFDISNTGATITGFTLMVVACQRVASTSTNTSTVNGINLGEYAASKPTNDLSGFYTITPNDVTIPDGYIVTYFLKRADGSTSEINCSAHFHFIDA